MLWLQQETAAKKQPRQLITNVCHLVQDQNKRENKAERAEFPTDREKWTDVYFCWHAPASGSLCSHGLKRQLGLARWEKGRGRKPHKGSAGCSPPGGTSAGGCQGLGAPVLALQCHMSQPSQTSLSKDQAITISGRCCWPEGFGEKAIKTCKR